MEDDSLFDGLGKVDVVNWTTPVNAERADVVELTLMSRLMQIEAIQGL